MNKEETIRRYGKEAYAKQLAQQREYREERPDQVIANNQELNRKGGSRYDKHLKDQHTGIPGEKNKIRSKHQYKYKPYKDIIAPESQIHHEWVPDTSEYRGVALVEKEQHMHGFVDVIEILDGSITLLTEEEIKRGEKQIGRPTYRTD